MTAFHAGALNINVSKFDAEEGVELIQDKKVTMFLILHLYWLQFWIARKRAGKISAL